MIAFGLSIALVLFWTVLGYALIVAIYQKPNIIQNVLVAPVVGIAATLLPTFFISRLGIPVGQFGIPLLGVLLVFSAFILWRRRPLFPFRRLLPFGIILLFALVLAGRPLLEFGFNWISYGNDDYANYVVNAHRLLTHGFFDSPLPSALATGRDSNLFSWILFIYPGTRQGADLLLAWTASVTGLSASNVFMPVIIAFHLCLVSAATALVYQSRRYRRAALITCCMLSVSALLTLGTVYQLIAQVVGMALACGVAAILFRPFAHLRRSTALRLGVLITVVFAALMISYPEIMPFVGLGFFLYLGVGIVRRRQVLAWRPVLYIGGVALVLLIVILNLYLLDFVEFLLSQFVSGVLVDTEPIFPYYLIPSGLSAFWGFQPFYQFPSEPFLSFGIIAGAVLLLMGVVFALRQAWRQTPAATIALAMLVFGMFLFIKRGDFGLFKLTMFIQPFFIGAFVLGWLQITRRWRPFLQAIPLVLIAGYGLVTQFTYVEISRGLDFSGPNEVPLASANHVLTEFETLVDTTHAAYYETDSNHTTLYKLQSIALDGHSAEYLSAAEISILQTRFIEILSVSPAAELYSPFQSIATELSAAFESTFALRQFNLMNDENAPASNEFYTSELAQVPPEAEQVALLTTPFQSALNLARLNWFQDEYYIARPLEEAENYLVFVESELGQQYYLPQFLNKDTVQVTSTASLFRTERDYFYPKSIYVGLGRHLLFEVLNPSSTVRIRLNFTATLRSDGEYLLPPAVTIGASRSPFPMMGRGSARVFSQPLTTQQIGGRDYLQLDMGDDGSRYTSAERSGLMALYGNDISLDTRRIVGFARDISVISEAEYASLNPPTSLSSFPADLANPDLEYSGIYEDGWLSESSFFCLAQPQADTPLRIHALNPLLDDPSFTQDLTVLVDGEEVLQQNFVPGEIDVTLPSANAGRHCIELRFSHIRHFTNGDLRPFAALLTFIGYE